MHKNNKKAVLWTKLEFSFQPLFLIMSLSARVSRVQHTVFSFLEVLLFHSEVIPVSFLLNQADEYP